ncbi:tyrosine-type recombinase/integrase [Parabacteroides sp.]
MNKDKQYPLVLQLIYRRRKREIYTPYRLYKEELNVEKESLRAGKRNKARQEYIREAGEYVSRMKEMIGDICRRLADGHSDYSVDDVLAAYKCCNDYNNLFVFADYLVKEQTDEGRKGTASNYRRAVRAFGRFIDDPSFTFDRLTPLVIGKYQLYLHRKGNKPNTVWHYVYQLRAIYRKAASMHIVSSHSDPFSGIELKREKTSKRAISTDNLREVASVNLLDQSDWVQLARDVFMFSFYSRGMSFVDMCYLRKENLKGNTISYRRRKTGQLLEIKIEPALLELVKKYADPSSPYLLPMLREDDSYEAYRAMQRKLDKRILQIGKLLMLPFPLTFYVARHTWATIARDEGIQISVISSCLGHTSEKTTHIYLGQINHDLLDDANNRVINCWKKQ